MVDTATCMTPVNSPIVSDVLLSPASSSGSYTVTPNTPITNVPTLSNYVDVSTKTDLDGIQVGKMVRSLNIISDTLPQPTLASLKTVVNAGITKITD